VMKMQTVYTLWGMLLIGGCSLFLIGLLFLARDVHNHTERMDPLLLDLTEVSQSLERTEKNMSELAIELGFLADDVEELAIEIDELIIEEE